MQPPKHTDASLVTLLYADPKRLPPEVILDAIDACPWIPQMIAWPVYAALGDVQYGAYMVRQGLRERAIPLGGGEHSGEQNMRSVQAHLFVEDRTCAAAGCRPEAWFWHHVRPTGDDAHDLMSVLRNNFEIEVALLQPNVGPFALVSFQQIQSWLDAAMQLQTHPWRVKCDLGRSLFESREDFLDWGIGLLEDGFGAHEDDGTGNCSKCGVPRGEVERWNKRRPEPWMQRRFAPPKPSKGTS